MPLSPWIFNKFKSADEALAAQITEDLAPSVQYAFFDKDRTIYHYRRGYSDIRNKKTVESTTSFNAYSITKTFTALAVLQLAERGLLNIDHRISKYLPSFPYDQAVTIKQIITHTAGIPNPIPLSWIHLPEEHDSFNSKKFFSSIFKRNKSLSYAAGTNRAYSNLGFVLLGQMIEEVSGLTYENYIVQNIIDKLDIQNGSLGFTIPDPEKHSVGYQKRWTLTNLVLSFLLDKKKFMCSAEGLWKPFKPIYVNGDSYGGLIGTFDGLMKYLQELLNPDTILIAGKYKNLLFTEHVINGKPTGMSLSWFTRYLNGHRYYMHAGGGGGFYSEIRIYPAIGKGSLIVFNRTGITNEYFLDKIDKFFVS